MVQTAEPWHRNHPSTWARTSDGLASCRSLLVQPEMCPVVVVVPRQNAIRVESVGFDTTSIGFSHAGCRPKERVGISWRFTNQLQDTHRKQVNPPPPVLSTWLRSRWSASMRRGRNDGADRRALASQSPVYLGPHFGRPRVLPEYACPTRDVSGRRGSSACTRPSAVSDAAR
jgi:hypothetical protein